MLQYPCVSNSLKEVQQSKRAELSKCSVCHLTGAAQGQTKRKSIIYKIKKHFNKFLREILFELARMYSFLIDDFVGKKIKLRPR